ncbi:hypothetical protein [Parvibaculum sp.]|uniref:hypothetical protein n=1 Tax=Parvibaculum sp. TaxID=2024848 RepID=UPI003296BDC4
MSGWKKGGSYRVRGGAGDLVAGAAPPGIKTQFEILLNAVALISEANWHNRSNEVQTSFIHEEGAHSRRMAHRGRRG